MEAHEVKSISAILFDLGNVLVKVDYGAFLRSLGFDHRMTDQDLYDLLENESRAFELGEMTVIEYLKVVNAKLARNYSFAEFRKAWTSILPAPVPGVAELAEELSSRYRLMALSNTNALHFEHMLEMLPILKKFECCFLSYKIGALKPDPAIFNHVLERVRTPAQELVFVDDLEENIKAARRAGMTGIVFGGIKPLRKELHKLKLL